MTRLPTKDEILAALMRAVHTAAQAFLAYISIGMAIQDVDWKHALSVALVAAVYSIVKSIAVGMPETKTSGTLVISDSDEDTVNWNFVVEQPLDELAKAKTVRLKVNNNAKGDSNVD